MDSRDWLLYVPGGIRLVFRRHLLIPLRVTVVTALSSMATPASAPSHTRLCTVTHAKTQF